MYELLSGSVPFKGDNAVEIALKQMKEKIPDLHEENPAIPMSVYNVILKATAKNPKNRYNSSREMHDDLLTCLNKNKNITPEDCVKKYSLRMILTLLVFGIPFAMMQIIMETKKISFSIIPKALYAVINNDGWRHLWYIYMLIGIYLMLPVIKKFSDNASKKEMYHVLLWMFIFNYCTPLIDKSLGTTIGITLPITYPIFYLFLGKTLSDYTPDVLKKRSVLLVIIAFLFSIIALIEINMPNIVDAIRSYDSPIIALLACSIYLLFKDIKISDKKGELLWKFDRMCFGVYIVHPFFIHLFYKFFDVTPVKFEMYHVMTMCFFIVFTLLSFASSFILRLIKPLKKYVL